MPKRIVKSAVMVQRGGTLVYPPVGAEFDFTTDEIAAFNKQTPCPIAKVVVVDQPVAAVQPKAVEEKPAAVKKAV